MGVRENTANRRTTVLPKKKNKKALISLSERSRLCPGDGACSVGMQQAAPLEGKEKSTAVVVGGVEGVGVEQTDRH